MRACSGCTQLRLLSTGSAFALHCSARHWPAPPSNVRRTCQCTWLHLVSATATQPSREWASCDLGTRFPSTDSPVGCGQRFTVTHTIHQRTSCYIYLCAHVPHDGNWDVNTWRWDAPGAPDQPGSPGEEAGRWGGDEGGVSATKLDVVAPGLLA